ncbi:hypothetical protein AVEN_108782-1 [Araneus ventricosus]|uniref:Uncharacterized protein n=1 Tax=Araneus ventricosus TaxID=182803 RepID=A0A4Y1ZQ13_ARAVE|nr:hypothetical protein AVEN_108782-1 [Araneus ventricosus]
MRSDGQSLQSKDFRIPVTRGLIHSENVEKMVEKVKASTHVPKNTDILFHLRFANKRQRICQYMGHLCEVVYATQKLNPTAQNGSAQFAMLDSA